MVAADSPRRTASDLLCRGFRIQGLGFRGRPADSREWTCLSVCVDDSRKERGYKPMHKNPDPTTYERKAFSEALISVLAL